MRLLVDTRVWLWMLASPERIARRTLAMLTSDDNERAVSAVSVWEISIKYHLGKLTLAEPPAATIDRWLQKHRARPLSVDAKHALRAGELPRHHGDPFDRMLIAQAQVEDLTLVTADPRFAKYDVKVLRAE